MSKTTESRNGVKMSYVTLTRIPGFRATHVIVPSPAEAEPVWVMARYTNGRRELIDEYGFGWELEHSWELKRLIRAAPPRRRAPAPAPAPAAPTSDERRGTPLYSGCIAYFPDALAAVAQHSKWGNDKHNPGQPMHWSKHKSTDHADCSARHLADHGTIDPETGKSHTIGHAWRALALLQIEIEATRAGMTPREYVAKLKRDAEERDTVAADDTQETTL